MALAMVSLGLHLAPMTSNQDTGWGFNILLALTTQVVGFGIAGLTRKFLVEPGKQ